MHNHKKWRGGFTLVEILVVLAVVAIISSISFGAFRSVSQGNKRTNCQSNLAQIYKSVRLYSQDYDGRFPYLNEGGAAAQASTPRGGLGLWSLYTFPKMGQFATTGIVANNSANCSASDVDLPPIIENENDLAAPTALAGYVRSTKIFHCPADRFSREVEYRDLSSATVPKTCASQKIDSATFSFKQGDNTYVNPSYLSYQGTDPTYPTSPESINNQAYSSFRSAGPTVRQLTPYSSPSGVNTTLDRPTKDMSIVTWCRFHRSLGENGLTLPGKRNFDNVLFSDGSVQSLPAVQDVKETPTSTPTECSAWQRVPRDKAENMISATNCTPSP